MRLHVEKAARTMLDVGVIAYPTEAVYGLGCLPTCPDAVERILSIKQRSWKKGLLLIAADLHQVEEFARLPSAPRRREILSTWPGPVSWILDARPGLSRLVTGSGGRVGMRVTAHPLAAALCRRAGSAIVSTSANRGGSTPLRTALQVHRQLGHLVDYVVPGELGGLAAPSEIRDARDGRILRAS
jgi:L-threonylcarbamoyladenylate synthase